MINTEEDMFEYAKTIDSRASFVKFVSRLSFEFHHSKDEWENDKLETFLAGLANFTRDIGGFYKNRGEMVDIETISWRMAAQMLLAATVYGN